MQQVAVVVSVLALVCSTTGCRALRNVDGAPAGAGPNSMLDDVAVGQNRCADADGDARPFVVEWDATDLGSFEAKASRDLVFVAYEGCEIRMLYGCSDNGVPGRYGAYDSPIFTSGTVESFEMRNQDEVYAKLPLGAASFGGSVEVGETLELLYFVSGVVNSTRNYVERAAIADNGRCEDATHFVSGYNLGAFRLLAHEQAKSEVSVGVGRTPAGVGGSTDSESSNLKQGGDLDSCETHGQLQCRVPIRLVLQAIDETRQDLDAGGAGAPRPDPVPSPATDTVSERAAKLRQAAEDKGDAGDGPGCLEDLDRADALDNSDETRADALSLRGMCTMLAGDCEGGEEMLYEAAALADRDKKASKLQVDAFVSRASLAYCPLDQLEESSRGMATWTRVRAARDEKQPAVCEANAKAALKLIEKQRKAGQKPDTWAMDAVGETVECLWRLERCDAAKNWQLEHYRQIWPDDPRAEVEKKAQDVWTARHEETGCEN